MSGRELSRWWGYVAFLLGAALHRAVLLGCAVACVNACDTRRVVVDGASNSPADAATKRDQGTRDVAVDLSQREQTIRACVVAASCGATGMYPGEQKGLASRCVDWFATRNWPQDGYGFGPDSGLLDRLVECAAQHGPDCRRFFECYGGNWVGPTACREGGRCKGDWLVGDDEGDVFLDCAALGMACVDLATGAQRACCASSCPMPDSATSCSGTKGSVCLAGALLEFDCGPSGRVCATEPGLCQGTGGPCTYDQDSLCTDGVAQFCSAGRWATVDCRENPFSSNCSPTQYRPCRPRGDECDESFEGECVGGQVTVCVDGTKVSLDCGLIGFETCRHDLAVCTMLL